MEEESTYHLSKPLEPPTTGSKRLIARRSLLPSADRYGSDSTSRTFFSRYRYTQQRHAIDWTSALRNARQRARRPLCCKQAVALHRECLTSLILLDRATSSSVGPPTRLSISCWSRVLASSWLKRRCAALSAALVSICEICSCRTSACFSSRARRTCAYLEGVGSWVSSMLDKANRRELHRF